MTTYYPSVVFDIRLMFDEALRITPDIVPQTTQEFVERPPIKGGEPAQMPLILKGRPNVSYIFGRIPKSASIELPGYRQAGQFSCEFDFRDLPIDPRTVRAASVEVHVGTVTAEDFAAGMTENPSGRSRRSVLQTRSGSGPNPETLRMVGLVDEWGVTHDNTGSIVTFRGRDLRGVLLDTPIGVLPGAQAQLLENLDWGASIQSVVQAILNFNPLFQEISVLANPAEWPDGVLPSPGNPGIVPRHRRGARGQRAGGRGTPNADSGNLNFWDLIVRACYLVGAIPFFVGRDLVIRPSRSIFEQTLDPNIPTPFADGSPRETDQTTRTALTPPLRVRRLVYGRDVETLSFDRKYAGFQRPRVVRCSAVDQSSTERGANRIVSGRWPPESAPQGARRTRVAPGGQTAHEEILDIRPGGGIVDAGRLATIARGIYEEIGRGEMGGTIVTKNLASFGGSNADPDLIRAQPGDGIELMVDARAVTTSPPLVSTLTSMTRSSFEEAVQEITSRLGDENLARVIVATARGQVQELQRFFRVATVKIGWDAKSGAKVDLSFQNYVVVRNQLGSPNDASKQAPWWETGESPPDDAVQTGTSRTEGTISADAPVGIVGGST